MKEGVLQTFHLFFIKVYREEHLDSKTVTLRKEKEV